MFVCVYNRDCYTEKCVMNNYFGIGLDAKISLDFNNKRDEHPEKCRYASRHLLNVETTNGVITQFRLVSIGEELEKIQ